MGGSNVEIRFVTGNQGKVNEIRRWLEPYGFGVVMDNDRFVEVQADTLETVIIEGMGELLERRGRDEWFMKDDSGLFIDSLGGFPGVYSAYVQGTIGNGGILTLMENVKDRRAVFRTVIGLNVPGKGLSVFRGECRGAISVSERGDMGFGYDPIFIPDGRKETFAEMSTDEKNMMSHRIDAVRKMREFLDGYVDG